MVLFGAGEVFGGLFIGWLVDKLGSKKTIYFNLFIITATFACTIGYLSLNSYGFLSFLMAFLWGVEDSCVNTHT